MRRFLVLCGDSGLVWRNASIDILQRSSKKVFGQDADSPTGVKVEWPG